MVLEIQWQFVSVSYVSRAFLVPCYAFNFPVVLYEYAVVHYCDGRGLDNFFALEDGSSENYVENGLLEFYIAVGERSTAIFWCFFLSRRTRPSAGLAVDKIALLTGKKRFLNISS